MGAYTNEQKVQIIKDNPNRALLNAARKMAALLNMHITGEGLHEHIQAMPFFEKKEVMQLRRKYAKSNKDLFERLFRPRDKVFTARGGSKKYDLPKSEEEAFRTYLSEIMYGQSLEKWIENSALKAWDIDPMSLIFMEIDEKGDVYPTYKSTDCIHDYELDGRRPEYVVFTLSRSEIKRLVRLGFITEPVQGSVVYRFVDDVTDCVVIRTGETYSFPDGAQFPNYFMEVPGQTASNIKRFNSDQFCSTAEIIVELANEYLVDCSTKTIAKKYHMFPKPWEVASACNTCGGTQYVDGEACPDCKGSGKNSHTRVSDVIKIEPADDNVKVPIPPGGYFTPDKAGWEMMNDEQDRLEFMMERTYWGAKRQIKATGQESNGATATATEIKYDEQPTEARLRDFTAWAQNMHKYIADLTGRIMYLKAYRGSSISYGDRYVLESPDQIWEKYQNARKNGAPLTTLDSHLIEFYESKFSGNPTQLQKHLVLMRVEPFIHYDAGTITGWMIPEVEHLKKVFFGEWLATKTDMDIVSTAPEALRKDLEAYASERKPPKQPTDPAEPGFKRQVPAA